MTVYFLGPPYKCRITAHTSLAAEYFDNNRRESLFK